MTSNQKLVIQHTPIKTANPGDDLKIAARVTGLGTPSTVLLHYRPLNQTVDWKSIPMQSVGNDRFEATIPGKAITRRWDLMYYLESRCKHGGGTLWPSWLDGQPYVVVQPTGREATAKSTSIPHQPRSQP